MDFTDERSRSTSTQSQGGEGGATEEVRARDFDRHRSQGNILFVGNLPFQTPWQNIKDQFRRAGKVRYTDLIADRVGRPKGSALVTMSTSDGARRAIRLFNETEFEGRRLIVRLFDDGPRPPLVQRENMPSYNRRSNRQDGGGAQQHAEGGAAQARQQQGNNNRGGQQNNNNNNNQGGRGGTQQQSRGGSQQKAQASAAHAGQGDVPKPRSQQVPESDRKLFISNLPFDCTAAALRETFQQIGAVERSEIIVGRNGKSRGMGIVVLSATEEARVAIAEFDGIEMAGRAMNVRLDNKA